ncbi:MAG: hypothetical protein U1E76_09090 [Planctomycetota bacterium]
MTAGPMAQQAPDAGTLPARLRALERQLQQAGHTLKLLPADVNAELFDRLLGGFALTGEFALVEVFYELAAPRLIEALRVTIFAENLAFDPTELLPDLLARLLRAAPALAQTEMFDETLEQLSKSVVLEAQKAASRSLVREQRAHEIQTPAEQHPIWELPVGAAQLQQGFAALQEGYRRCLVLRERDGLAYYDIGDQGGLDANVATRVRRARERLYQLAAYLGRERPSLTAPRNDERRTLDPAR